MLSPHNEQLSDEQAAEYVVDTLAHGLEEWTLLTCEPLDPGIPAGHFSAELDLPEGENRFRLRRKALLTRIQLFTEDGPASLSPVRVYLKQPDRRPIGEWVIPAGGFLNWSANPGGEILLERFILNLNGPAKCHMVFA